MARKFLTAIDLTKNELQNPAIHNLAAAPSSPVKGQMYFDTVGNTMYWWNGTAWIAATGSGAVSYGSVPAETTFGIAKNDGVATTVARSDHTHGSPTHDNAAHAAINLSALAVATANVNMGGFLINNLGTPTAGTDAANKSYVDNTVAGLSWKDSVRLASTANVNTAAAAGPIDGITPGVGERVLLKNQTLPAENGIYVYTGTFSRATDNDIQAEILGMAVYIQEGTTNGDTAWVCTADAPITVGTTALPFVQFSGGGAVTAGAGMTQSGNVLNVIGDASITVAADSVSRAALTGDVTAAAGANATTIANDAVTTAKIINNAVTNAKLAQMGAYTLKGNSTAGIADPNDISRTVFQTMMAGYLARKYATSVGGATAEVITHNLNTRDIVVNLARVAAPYDTVECDVERTTTNTVTLRFAVAPAAAEYYVTILG